MKKITAILCALFTLSAFTHSSLGHSSEKITSQNATHSLSRISKEVSLLALEDESQWIISESDVDTFFTWNLEDPLVVTANGSSNYSYRYNIYNPATKTSVAANLYYGPKIGGIFTKQVTEIDFNEGGVSLSDGSSWQVAARSQKKFSKWKLSDYIIVGTSKYENNNILINVNLNQYVESTKY